MYSEFAIRCADVSKHYMIYARPEDRLKLYWRFFETEDEYFPYSEKEFPPQGLWNIYGVHLPDEVLQKIYFGNALKLLPTLREKYQRSSARIAASRKE